MTMSFNTIIDWNSCSAAQQQQLLTRPVPLAISASAGVLGLLLQAARSAHKGSKAR